MDSTIIVSLIITIGTITVSIFGAFDKIFDRISGKNNKKEKSINESPLYITFEQLSELNFSINDLFSNTTADRFLLLISNANDSYSWVSAIYEQHDNIGEINKINLSLGATGRYIKMDTDRDYRTLISDIRKESPVRLETYKMSDNMLKNIYIYERVTFSNIYFLYDIEKHIDGKKYTETLFCSIAKHGQNNFNKNEEIYMKSIVDRIKNDIIPNKTLNN